MATLSKANFARFTTMAAISAVSIMAGTPELAGILGATAVAAIPVSSELLQNVQALLKEPAQQWAGDVANGIAVSLARIFEDSTPGLNEQLRIAVAKATETAVADVRNMFQQLPYYQEATDKAAIDEIFKTLSSVTKGPQFLRTSISSLRANGEIDVLVLNNSRWISDILKEEIEKHLADHDERVVNFLRLYLPGCIVTRFIDLLSKNSDEGNQARNAFTLLHLTSILEGIRAIRGQLDTLLFGQSDTNKRLEEFELRFIELIKLANKKTTVDTSLVFKYVQEYLQQVSRRETLHQVTVYISTVSDHLLGFRDEVKQYFGQYGSYYIIDGTSLLTDKERQDCIATCDLFVGLYLDPKQPDFQGIDELNIAYIHFRRCLIYTPGNPPAAVGDNKDVRVAPVYRFVSTTDLVTSLHHRLQELERGELTGFSSTIITEKWNYWIIDQRQELWQNDLYNHTAQLASPIEKLWKNDFGQRWHVEALQLAEAAMQKAKLLLGGNNDLPGNAKQNLKKYTVLPVDCQVENYERIRKRLADWNASTKMEQLIKDIKEHIGSKKQKGGAVKRAQAQLHMWLQAVKQLNTFLATPRYRNCLLVLGQLGSGKSHFVVRLLEQHNQEHVTEKLFCLYVPLELAKRVGAGQVSINELVMTAAAFTMYDKPVGPAWRSLHELAAFVSTEGGKLLIILDDLDRWVQSQTLQLSKLQEYIEQHTNIHNLYWILCASEADYEFAVNSEYAATNFWHYYGYVDSIDPTSSTGWVRLDRLNKQERVWQSILKTELGVEAIPDSILATLDDVESDLLSLPFVTRIIADLIQSGEVPLDDLPNLNYISFVVNFWKKRFEKALRRSQIDRFHLERAIYLTSGATLIEGSSCISKPLLLKRVLELDNNRTDNFDEAAVRTAIRNLASIELLREPTDNIDRLGHRVELDVLPIWLWKSGFYLIDKLVDDIRAQTDVHTWLTKYIGGAEANAYLQGVIEFLIMLVDSGDVAVTKVEERLKQDVAILLAQNIVLSSPAYQSRVWLATSKSSTTFQHSIATWLEQHIKEVKIFAASMYQYLYFLKNAAEPQGQDSGVSLSVRIKLAQPYYEAIEPRYVDYFLDSIEELAVHGQTGEELIASFTHFYGIEPILQKSKKWPTSEVMAAWAYGILRSLLPQNEPDADLAELRRWIMQFLEETARVQVNQRLEKYGYFWVCFLRCYCDNLAIDLTQARMTLLEQEGWFNASGALAHLGEVREMMENQLTSASGKYFREKAKSTSKVNYTLLVKQWAESPAAVDRQRVAFFLIYHSVPAKGPYRTRKVNEELWTILQVLRQETHIQKLLEQKLFADWYKIQVDLRSSADPKDG